MCIQMCGYTPLPTGGTGERKKGKGRKTNLRKRVIIDTHRSLGIH